MAAAWLASGGKLPFGVKPQTPVLNRGHLLVRGLVFDANYFAPGLGGNTEIVGVTRRSTYTGTTTSIGPHGVARTFPGAAATDIDTYASNGAVNSLAVFTVEFLFKLNGSTTGGNGRIVAKGASEARFRVEIDPAGGSIFLSTARSTDEGRWNSPASSVPSGAWCHAVVAYDWGSTANDPAIWINGVPQAITEVSAPVGTAGTDTANLYIGNRDSGNRCINGDISHVRIWNRALNGGEVRQLFTDPFGIYVDYRRVFSPVPAASTQTLTPSLFTNTPTFYAPTVTPGPVTLTPGLFTNTPVFYGPTVSQGGSTQTLTASLFTNTPIFFAATVTPGAVTLTPGLFTNSPTLYAPTVTPGTVTLSPGLLTNQPALFSPTVVPGAVTLSPGLLTNTPVIYPPTVFVPGGIQTLTASLFTNSPVFYTATITQPDPPGTYPLAIEGDPSTVAGRLLNGGSVVAGSIPITGRVIAGYLRGRP